MYYLKNDNFLDKFYGISYFLDQLNQLEYLHIIL